MAKNKIESSFSKWKPFFPVWLGRCLRALGLFLFPEFLTGHLDFSFSLNPILVAKTISKFKFDHFAFWRKNLCNRIKFELFELFCVNFFSRPSSLKCLLLPVPKIEFLLLHLLFTLQVLLSLPFHLWTRASPQLCPQPYALPFLCPLHRDLNSPQAVTNYYSQALSRAVLSKRNMMQATNTSHRCKVQYPSSHI